MLHHKKSTFIIELIDFFGVFMFSGSVCKLDHNSAIILHSS